MMKILLPKFKVSDKVKLNRDLSNNGHLFKRGTIGEVVAVNKFMCRVAMEDAVSKEVVTWLCYERNLDEAGLTEHDIFVDGIKKLLHSHRAERFISEQGIDKITITVSDDYGPEYAVKIHQKDAGKDEKAKE